MENLGEDFKFFISFKILQVVTLVIFATHLTATDFGIGMLGLVIAELVLLVIKWEGKKKIVVKFWEALLFIMLLFYVSTKVQGPIGFGLQLASIAVMIGTVTPFLPWKHQPGLYKNKFIAQNVMLFAGIIGIATGMTYEVILVSYILYLITNIILFFKGLPHMVQIDLWPALYNRGELADKLPEIARSCIFIYTMYQFGIVSFSYIFLAYSLGFLFFEIVNFGIKGFSFKQYRTDTLRYNFAKFVEYVGFFIIGISAVTIVLAQELVALVLGSGWAEAAEIFRLFLFSGLIRGFFESIRLLVEAKQLARINYLEVITLAAALFILMKYGVMSVPMSFFLASVIVAAAFVIAVNQTGFNFFGLAAEYFYLIVSGVISILITAVIRESLVIDNFILLGLVFTIGTLVYLVSVYIFNKTLYKRFVRFIFETK